MKKSILILDDDKDILFVCAYLLEEMGWDVHMRTHCNDVLELVKKLKPAIILMDNWIPGMGGIVATQTLKADKELRSIPIIFFSANSDIKNLSIEAGADMYLSKPFDIEVFEKVIKNTESLNLQ